MELTSQLPDRSISARTTLDQPRLRALPGVLDVATEAGRARLTSTEPEAAVRALLDADPNLSDLRVEAASLEEAVVSLTSDTEAVGRPGADSTQKVPA